jgi:hypothetical protein
LAPQNFDSGGFEFEPGGAVDFRKLLEAAGFRRPFQRESVAFKSGDVELGAQGPGMDQLAAGLTDGFEGEEISLGRGAGFFLELTEGRRERVFAIRDFPLRDRPGRLIFVGPQRAAGVDEEHFHTGCGAAKQQESGASIVFSGRR